MPRERSCRKREEVNVVEGVSTIRPTRGVQDSVEAKPIPSANNH